MAIAGRSNYEDRDARTPSWPGTFGFHSEVGYIGADHSPASQVRHTPRERTIHVVEQPYKDSRHFTVYEKLMSMTLTTQAIESAQSGPKVRYLADGAYGLRLRIQPTGSKVWTQTLWLDGKQSMRGLGRYPKVSLEQARQVAQTNYQTAKPQTAAPSAMAATVAKAIAEAQAPLLAEIQALRQTVENQAALLASVQAGTAAVPTASGLTFQDASERSLDRDMGGWKRPEQGRGTYARLLAQHVYPAIGGTDVGTLSVQDVTACLTAIKAPTAQRKAIIRISATCKWAVATGNRATALDMAAVQAALPKARRTVKHYATCGYKTLPEAMATLPDTKAGTAVALLAHTALRTNELLGMDWREVNLTAKLWTIPSERMKGGTEHQVPLSAQAVALLQAMRPRESGKVFETSHPTMGRTAKAAGMGTLHGLRSAFIDWAAETQDQAQLADYQLAHKVGSAVARAYQRSTLLEQRRALMAEWSRHLAG